MTKLLKKNDVTERLRAEALEIEAAESDVDDGAPLPSHVRVTRGNGRSKVLQVRLNVEELEQLEKLADAQMIPVSTMARAMLLRSMR